MIDSKSFPSKTCLHTHAISFRIFDLFFYGCSPSDSQIAYLCLAYAKHPSGVTSVAMLASGLFWTAAYVTYIVAIRRHGAYIGVPIAALYLNIAWETVFAWIWTEQMGTSQRIVNRLWWTFDVALFIGFIRYEFWNRPGWYIMLGFTLIALLVCIIVELEDYNGIYMAFGQNLVMSILFCYELWTSPKASTARSIHFLRVGGICRLVGTACASFTFWYRTTPSVLLRCLFLTIFVWDAAYVASACWQLQREGSVHHITPGDGGDDELPSAAVAGDRDNYEQSCNLQTPLISEATSSSLSGRVEGNN